MTRLVDVNCPRCGRLWFRADAAGVVENYCKTPACRRVVRVELKKR